MANFTCPKCNNKSYFSLAQAEYKGPYRCTECKTIWNVVVENDEFTSCKPLDQQAIDKLPLHNPYK